VTTLIESLLGRGRKAFTEPAFWQLDHLRYPMHGSTLGGDERIENDFEGYVRQAYKDNGVIFACILARQLLFSETRFQFRRFAGGRPGDLFGDPLLALLEQPWPGGTTGELLARMESDASLAGNFFATTADDHGRIGRGSRGGPGRRAVRIRPDWVTIVSGSPSGSQSPHALDAKIVGYQYLPPGSPDDEMLLLPEEVCHYSPIPDPHARWRGMSWLTPVLREIEADKAATVHKGRFFRNGATPALSVSLDKDVSVEAFEKFKAAFELNHKGADNAYRTLFLGGGADVKPLTMDLRQLDFKMTQGAGETRIAAAARVPPVIVGLSEGLAAQTYSNYNQAKRHFGDGTIRPLWRMAAASLQPLVDRGDGAQLWYDDRDISFLREDLRDAAEIQGREADTVRTLIEAGYEPDTAVKAVTTGDFTVLVHTGYVSVQLQQRGANPAPSLNGRGVNGQQALPAR
jgi:phage portal protein BeeE